MEEEFDKWLGNLPPIKVLSSFETSLARLAFYEAYDIGYEKGRDDEFTIGQEWI